MTGKRWKRNGMLEFLKSQAIALILFAAVAVMIVSGVSRTSDARSSEELEMAEDSVRRAVVSCYAIEGRYPESYEYLKENYGVNVDEEKYFVHYEIFASNIMPEITITASGMVADGAENGNGAEGE